MLTDGRSPAPRAVADLLVALHDAGAAGISLPACAQCGRKIRGFCRAGQDWYCSACARTNDEPCGACGENRTVASLDRAGRPRCAKCPGQDDRDPVTVIHGIVTALDPGAGRELVAGAVRRPAPQPACQKRLAWALEASPALLTGDGHLAPLRAIPRFIEALDGAGIAGVVRPSCGKCGRMVRIDKPLDGVRVCRTCIAHSRTEPCARSGAAREPVTRDEQGQPVCANCFIAAPENLEACAGCGRVRPVDRRTADGPLCARCPPLAVTTCAACGQTAPCGTSRATGKPCCPACRRRRAACSSCGRHDAVASGTPDRPLCAACTPPPPWAGCPVCSDPDYPGPGQCPRCVISARLDELMGPDDRPLPPGLQALRREIAGAGHTITATRWLDKPSVAPVLSGLAGGRIPLTHQALDELPRRPAIDYLRHTLAAVGAPPARDEEMARLEAHLHGLLDAEAGPERRRLLHRYLIWHLVRRMRSRNNGNPVTRQQALLTRRLARGAVVFLDWLDSAGLTLESCRQADLDYWLASGQATYREEAGRLIRWGRPMFTYADGRPIRTEYLTHRFHTLVKDFDLPPIRLHDMRHGAATLALASHTDVKVIQQMLGHSSIVTTADTYTKRPVGDRAPRDSSHRRHGHQRRQRRARIQARRGRRAPHPGGRDSLRLLPDVSSRSSKGSRARIPGQSRGRAVTKRGARA